MKIEIRNDTAGELDEVLAHTDDGAPVLHMERMDEGAWWMSIGGVHVNLAAAQPSRTKVRGRWEDEENVDIVTVTDAVPTARRPAEADTVTRTSVELVKARDDVKQLTKERAACICDFEPHEVMVGRFLRDVDPLRVRAPFDEEDRITVHKRRLSAKTAPCWQHVVVCDEDGETGAIGDWCPDGWCESCERRQVLHLELRAARRRVVALTSGHLAATRAHMRRTGELPPAEPRKPKPEPRPLPTFEARPYPQPEPKEWPEDVPF